MAEKIVFHVSENNALYLCKHFSKLGISELNRLRKFSTDVEIVKRMSESGSKFLPDFFNGPYQLITFLNKESPNQIIPQGPKRLAYLFSFNWFIGTNAVVPIDELTMEEKDRMMKKERGGVLVWALNTNKLFFTKQVILILEGEQVITCFPGLYAPPLPSIEIDEIELKKVNAFWNEHVFIYCESQP